MPNKNSIHFLLLLLVTYRNKHISIFIISTVVVALLASLFFISTSIKKEIDLTLDAQADFVVQRYEAGKALSTPESWIDEFTQINGVENVSARVYGVHFFEPAEEYFLIVGIDFFDEHTTQALQKLINSIDVDKFLSKKNMIIGEGVKELLDYYHYFDYYIFRPPDRGKEKVYIYDVLPKETQIFSNDIIFMDIDEARKVLGVEDGYVTDIVLNIANPLEVQTIKRKLIISHFNMRIIEKSAMKRYYANLFNYKGGIFLIFYIVILMTFFLILYQRYSMISHVDAKEIAILRLVGWRINEVIWLKVGENFLVALFAYLLGVILAYVFVFYLNAPLLRDIFLGSQNLAHSAGFIANINMEVLGLIFLLFVIPFIVAILVPVWRVAMKEPVEVMR